MKGERRSGSLSMEGTVLRAAMESAAAAMLVGERGIAFASNKLRAHGKHGLNTLLLLTVTVLGAVPAFIAALEKVALTAIEVIRAALEKVPTVTMVIEVVEKVALTVIKVVEKVALTAIEVVEKVALTAIEKDAMIIMAVIKIPEQVFAAFKDLAVISLNLTIVMVIVTAWLVTII
ncbi:hypothetical protein B0H67DRAFT_680977 [Lasiosphaeris hirsuta]|uniref:Uncharacterized protein n=1 Tax=Lasiosphaeris hirsuta TaxID=260670 RepID=A0AA40B149_9PEZI|nr:hypothetical protein B0H67DRAFT_680977 [Lasiosphaeris hirsuta]